VRSKGRTLQRYSLHTGRRSDATERSESAADGQAEVPVEFVRQELTSYSGLELLRRYVRPLDLLRVVHAACAATGGDYGGRRLALLILSLPVLCRGAQHLRCSRRPRPSLGVGLSP